MEIWAIYLSSYLIHVFGKRQKGNSRVPNSPLVSDLKKVGLKVSSNGSDLIVIASFIGLGPSKRHKGFFINSKSWGS